MLKEYAKKYWQYAAILIIIIFGAYRILDYGKQKSAYENKIKYLSQQLSAFSDTIKLTKNKYNQIEAEKATLQLTYDDVKKANVKLTKNQNELYKIIEDDKNTIAAARIREEILIKIINEIKPVAVDTAKRTIEFKDTASEHFNYDFLVSNVIPWPKNTTPLLAINKIQITDSISIAFKWNDDKKSNYPISFTITHSNPYVTTTDMDSYMIPQINPDIKKPTFWERTKKTVKKIGTIAVYVGAGIGIGFFFL